ncbi:MAG: hypothetical protein LCH54_14925 [Bacteroidetes bacterium]|nr:hypothetical protein [Bacteroidota bacterium]
MKYLILFLLLSLFALLGCQNTKLIPTPNNIKPGIFKRLETGEKLELKPDSTYVWYRAPNTGHMILDKYCDYISTGKWVTVESNLFELTSDSPLLQSENIKYEIKSKAWGSQDSLYLEVIPAEKDLAVQYVWLIDGYTVISSGKSQIAKKDIFQFKKEYPFCNFYLTVTRDNTKTLFPQGESEFYVFYENINFEHSNHITVSLPDLNTCTLYFALVNHQYVLVKSENELKWRGDVWSRINE